MLETVIKRDGSKEEFSAVKINGWGKWASKHPEINTVDWGSVVMAAVSTQPQEVTSQELQKSLIKECLNKGTWSYYLMAGRLYASFLHKEVFGDKLPKVKDLHEKLVELGLMVKLNYDDNDYIEVEDIIDHKLDYLTPHFSLEYIHGKYAIRDRVSKLTYETQQYVFMRMAMTLCESDPKAKRMKRVAKLYKMFSDKKLSSPTPAYINLGTKLKGYASCCLYTSKDTIASLATANHIGFTMTAASAGLGNHYMTRSLGDSIRGGSISHSGKLPYFQATGKTILANMQAGRGGAGTTYISAYDPEVLTILRLRNPRSVEAKRNRDLHYALISNKHFAAKAAKGEDIFSFNIKTAPDLFEALFNGDTDVFTELYNKYEQDESFIKNYTSAREILLTALTEGLETGTIYLAQIDEINRMTPFKEKIFSSNLCLEVTQPAAPYNRVDELYSNSDIGRVEYIDEQGNLNELSWSDKVILKRDGETLATFAGELIKGDLITSIDDSSIYSEVFEIVSKSEEPEVSLCSLAAVNVAEVDTDEEYEEVMYEALKMIDYCIYESEYPLPHIEYTVRQRMNAGVGIMGLATLMAKKRLKFNTKEGMDFLHSVFERHMYFAIKASLRISKERGLAPWIHKTKWPEGWTPVEAYNRNVDKYCNTKLSYDWEALSEEIKVNGGIAHSSLVAYMPGESSSKALGQTNSIYPTRETTMVKTDNTSVIRWAAPHSDTDDYIYQSAWELSEIDAFRFYGIVQKFTDQAISADIWRDLTNGDKVPASELLKQYFEMVKNGVKTRYYFNSRVSKKTELTSTTSILDSKVESTMQGNLNEGDNCSGGFCSL